MLKSLYIKNYALIDSLEIEFSSGFSVITGETGAGKSIILGALSLILGQRADIKSIKQGETKCVIEGVFDVAEYDLKAFCEEKGIEYDAESFILRREILSSGKSRGFINDSPATLGDLKDLGSRLIDIHSQHQNLLLTDDMFQLQVVDTLAGTTTLLREYQTVYKDYKKAEKKLVDLKENILKSKEEEDYLRFQYESLKEANLVDGEQEELELELETLNHAEEIKSTLYKCFLLLSDDEQGVVVRLKEALSSSSSLTRVFNKAQEISQRIETSFIDLQDLSSELEHLAEDVEFNPERLEFVSSRLDLIYSLQSKHRLSSIAELMALEDEMQIKIENIDSSDSHLAEMEKSVKLKYEALNKLAQALSSMRKKSMPIISKNLVAKISTLGMPNVRFECVITPKKELDLSGADELVFMFSANKNIPLQPVSEIASGGEISRLMLCLKSMIAGATALPSIIFDEIDTGVSGEVADKMGNIMQEFGQNMQVLAITHLPQIASKGKAHYKVYKDDESDTTTTHLVCLSEQERIEELARMLSGSELTEAALTNAKVLLGLK